MTISTTTTSPSDVIQERETDRRLSADEAIDFPAWVEESQKQWGDSLIVPEWEDKDNYRQHNGWKVGVVCVNLHEKCASWRCYLGCLLTSILLCIY